MSKHFRACPSCGRTGIDFTGHGACPSCKGCGYVEASCSPNEAQMLMVATAFLEKVAAIDGDASMELLSIEAGNILDQIREAH